MRVRELKVSYAPHPAGLQIDGRLAMTPKAAASILVPLLEHEPTEVFVILLLNARGRVLAVHEVARGGLNTAAVEPRAVFRSALLANAQSVILAHNHPSGDPTPSPDDCLLTARLVGVGHLLGIPIEDHLVIGDGKFVSFHETGRLRPPLDVT